MTSSGFQETELVRTRSGHGSKRTLGMPEYRVPSSRWCAESQPGNLQLRLTPQTAMISAATLRSWRPQWLGWGRSGAVGAQRGSSCAVAAPAVADSPPNSAEQRLGGDLNSRDQSDLHGHPRVRLRHSRLCATRYLGIDPRPGSEMLIQQAETMTGGLVLNPFDRRLSHRGWHQGSWVDTGPMLLTRDHGFNG